MSRFAHVSYATFSDKGLVRGNNEDVVFALPEDGVFGVSDGMGGGEAGELASAWVEAEIRTALSGTADESPGVRLIAVREAIGRANARIRAYAQENGYAMMGATVAMLLLNPWAPASVLAIHVGDSRVYRLRGDVLEQLTPDHTVGADIAKALGEGAVGDHRSSRLSHVLTRAVGVSDVVAPEKTFVDTAPGDMFLVCTDGVSTMLADTELKRMMQAAETPRDAVDRISAAVRDNGAVDNYSLVVCRMADMFPPAEAHDTSEEEESVYLEERWNG